MATPFPFVAGAVLTAANLNAITELVTNTQTDNYTLAATDAGDRVIANKASAITFTVPNSVFTAAQIVRIHNIGAGTLTISAGAGMTLNGADVLTVSQYQGGELFFTSASSAIFFPTVANQGLTLVKSQTIGSAVSTVTVTGAFSADYDNYRVIIFGTANSSEDRYQIQLGSATTAYYSVMAFFGSNSVDGFSRQNNGSRLEIGLTDNDVNNFYALDFSMPFSSTSNTLFSGVWAARGYNGFCGGAIFSATSFTAFTLAPTTGTMTGGTIKVYGYKN